MKLRILEQYLPAFLRASKNRASEYVYLDAFAGEGHGRDRLTGEEFPGSARIALDVDEAGGFTQLRFFEHERRAAELERQLRHEYPDRDVRVYPGDCNREIPRALADLQSLKWAPTFAFVDPDGMEFEWGTLEQLAEHKRGYRPPGSDKPEFKAELWLLFPSAGLIRTLALQAAMLTRQDAERARRLFGTQDWRAIYDLRRDGQLTAPGAREEYVNLMRWRLERWLGYQSTHPLELKNTAGTPVYHMIFATDHPAGERIMRDLYSTAAGELPQMRREARERKTGQVPLFDTVDDDLPSGAAYEYEPPWDPPQPP